MIVLWHVLLWYARYVILMLCTHTLFANYSVTSTCMHCVTVSLYDLYTQTDKHQSLDKEYNVCPDKEVSGMLTESYFIQIQIKCHELCNRVGVYTASLARTLVVGTTDTISTGCITV